jgi:hypothetical protein
MPFQGLRGVESEPRVVEVSDSKFGSFRHANKVFAMGLDGCPPVTTRGRRAFSCRISARNKLGGDSFLLRGRAWRAPAGGATAAAPEGGALAGP